MARYAFSLVIAVLLLAGCGGQLFLPESIIDRVDPTEEPCTPFNPLGACPDGLECCNGVCDDKCDAWICACDPAQACVGGACTDITPDNECTPDNIDGLCPLDEVCINGTCVPISGTCGCKPDEACVEGVCRDIDAGEECSADNLAGLCVDGLVCIDGECIAINNACSQNNCNGLCPTGASCTGCRCVPIDRPCGPGALDGQCSSCYQCVAPGVCEILTCSPAAPSCACDQVDQYCSGGVCQQFLCGPSHLEGACEAIDVDDDGELDDHFCCSTGDCIPEKVQGADGCCGPDDCPFAGSLCSLCGGKCINEGTCVCDDDCPQFYECDIGTNVCVPDDDCPNGDVDCPADQYCDSADKCRPDTTCGVEADCDLQGLTAEFCSACGECIPAAMCCEPVDCDNQGLTGYGCSVENNCLLYPACDGTADCRPGEYCNPATNTCDSAGADCSANGSTSCVAVGADSFWCCPTGDAADCCAQGERCGAAGKCITDGQCVDSSDCYAPYFTCDTGSFTCVPASACTGGDCGAQICSTAGGCMPNNGTCAADGDCPVGEVCNAVWRCEPAISCGTGTPQVTRVPPNMLVVLDRSGSMNECLPCPDDQAACEDAAGCDWQGGTCVNLCTGLSDQTDCHNVAGCGWDGNSCEAGVTRYDTADRAITSVLTAWDTEIRFGLSLYPDPCAGSCSNACRYQYCTGCGADAGGADVPVDVGTTAAIVAGIAGTFPGGSTPTAPTLRAVEADRNGFGLPSSSDTTPRNNYIMLVTDGDANSGTNDPPETNCPLGNGEDDLVNCVLQRLVQDTVPVETFVVGFAFGGDADNLNCHAYYGGTARSSECPSITAANCDNQSGTCYYPADNEAELVAAMEEIVGSVASCNFSLDQVPPDDDLLYVYFYHQCDSLGVSTCASTPGCSWSGTACDGDPVRLARDVADGWHYQGAVNQVVFDGAACDQLRAGGVVPVVILGCCTGEGC